MKTVITYGTYDLLHQGHINLLRRAKELGDFLIVGVTSDSFDKGRGKLNVRNNVLERVEAVKATGYADKIIIEDYVGQKIDDIQKYNVDIFAQLVLIGKAYLIILMNLRKLYIFLERKVSLQLCFVQNLLLMLRLAS